MPESVDQNADVMFVALVDVNVDDVVVVEVKKEVDVVDEDHPMVLLLHYCDRLLFG